MQWLVLSCLVAGMDAPWAFAEEKPSPAAELQRLIDSRDALNQEIERLRKVIGHEQQVVTHVKIFELSLTKARATEIHVEGVKTDCLQNRRFGEALRAGLLDATDETKEIDPAVFAEKTSIDTEILKSEDRLLQLFAELKQAGALKVLAEPTVITTSGHSATLSTGGEYPIPVPQPNGDSTIEFKEFGTRLDLLPVLLGEGRVRLEIRPRVSELDFNHTVMVAGKKVPAFRTRMVDTVTEMNLGETLVLAGLVQHRKLEEPGVATAPAGDEKGLQVGTHHEADAVEPTHAVEKTSEEIELIVTVRAEVADAKAEPLPN